MRPVLADRKQRQNVSAFRALIATPASGVFAMPANARIRFVSTAGSAANTLAGTLTGRSTRSIRTPLLAAGGDVVVDWVERGVSVDTETGFSAQVDTGLGRWRTIANG